jgi:thiol-disulfide isomerase/thioredoxin
MKNANVLEYLSKKLGMNIISLSGMIPFETRDIDNKTITLESLKGKITLFDFWATWCKPCLEELPVVKDLYEKYHSRGFEVIGISLDFVSQLSMDEFRAWLKNNRITWPQIYDGKGWNSALAELYGIRKIPSTILVDRDGNVIDVDLRGESLVTTIDNLFR